VGTATAGAGGGIPSRSRSTTRMTTLGYLAAASSASRTASSQFRHWLETYTSRQGVACVRDWSGVVVSGRVGATRITPSA
jgi:hypothetical protein